MEFDTVIEDLDSLLFVLGRILVQLILRATRRALALASVSVTLALDGGGTHERTLKPALPLIDRAVLLKLLQLDLQTHPPAAGVLAIHLAAEPGVRSEIQTGLFSPQAPETTRLEVTLARIAALVGEDRVGRVVLTDSHSPQSFRLEAFTVNVENRKPRKSLARFAGLAIRRQRPPSPIEVHIAGTKLLAFSLYGTWHTIERVFGPWRRSGQWWSEEVWSREEWDVEAIAGDGTRLLALLSHNLLRSCWHLEALYD
jgi:protein ImuB